MVKRRISLVLAIVMVVGMLLSFTGCPIKEKERDYIPYRYRHSYAYAGGDGYFSTEEKQIFFVDFDSNDEYIFNVIDTLNETYTYKWHDYGLLGRLRYDGSLQGKIERQLPDGKTETGTFSLQLFSEREPGVGRATLEEAIVLSLKTESLKISAYKEYRVYLK